MRRLPERGIYTPSTIASQPCCFGNHVATAALTKRCGNIRRNILETLAR
jgi:hypothetical protein